MKNINNKILICSQGSIGSMYRQLISDNWPDFQIGLHTSKTNFVINENSRIKFFNSNLKECINWGPYAAIICNPAPFHIDYSIELMSSNIPVLIEKPIGDGLEAIEKVKKLKSLKNNCVALVGYVFRYEKGYRLIKNILNNNELGKINKAKFVCSSWLPDWRPDSDYRKTVSANKKLGGGVLLELSHELDLAISFLGEISLLSADLKRSGLLDINVEDSVLLKGKSKKCSEIIIELDFCTKTNKRYLFLSGTKGNVKWDIQNGNVQTDFIDKLSFIKDVKSDKKARFQSQLIHFFDCIDNNKNPKCKIEDGLLVLNLINQAKTFSKL